MGKSGANVLEVVFWNDIKSNGNPKHLFVECERKNQSIFGGNSGVPYEFEDRHGLTLPLSLSATSQVKQLEAGGMFIKHGKSSCSNQNQLCNFRRNTSCKKKHAVLRIS